MMEPFSADPVVGLVVTIPLMFALGFAIQKFLMGRAFAISSEGPLIIAFGISLVIQNATRSCGHRFHGL